MPNKLIKMSRYSIYRSQYTNAVVLILILLVYN